MNVIDFSFVIVRFFGLWLLFQCIFVAEQIASVYIQPSLPGGSSFEQFQIWAGIFNLVLFLIIGILLVQRPQLIAKRLQPEGRREEELTMTQDSLVFLCFSVAGLVFTVMGLEDLLNRIATWLFAPPVVMHLPTAIGGILAASFKTAVGLWLLLGFRGIAQSLHRLRTAGANLGTQSQN